MMSDLVAKCDVAAYFIAALQGNRWHSLWRIGRDLLGVGVEGGKQILKIMTKWHELIELCYDLQHTLLADKLQCCRSTV